MKGLLFVWGGFEKNRSGDPREKAARKISG
jgi:hypothetical protein